VRCGDARHNTSTARDIDNALAWAGLSEFNKYRSPHPKHSRHQLTLVYLGRAARDLPLSLLAHFHASYLQDMFDRNQTFQSTLALRAT
jgi:hypothetical protein